MKKMTLMAAMAIVAGTLASCGGQAPHASLKNDVDTLSYTLGITQAQGLKEYLVGSLGMDTAYMADFIKGMNEGVNAGDSKKKAAYIAGLNIGQQISNQMIPRINHQVFGEDSTQTISTKNYMSGFIATTTGKQGLMTLEEASQVSDSMMHIIQAREMEKVYGENRVAGEKFLAENATKEGIQTLEGGVQYRVITEGNGAIPADTSIVEVNYEGRLLDGTVFDSSYKRGQPATFAANQVIKGWTTALCHMPVGSKWEVYIPQELAYGERMTGQIKPFSALIFTIELIGIKEANK